MINTGDLTDVGTEESNWQRYFDITAPLGAIAPVIPVLGNHDAARGGAGALKTWELFDMPKPAPPFYTSFDLGGVHFIALDTNDGGGAQRDWLQDDLARARRHHARAVFAFCHEPPWSHGLHGDSHRMIRDYAPLLVAGHVDVLFCGHDHIYERGAGPTPKGKLTYIVTGGGGAPLYNPRCQAASGPPPGRRSGPAAALSAARGGADQDLPLRHGHGRGRRHPALPEAPGRLCGRAVRRASTPSTVSAVPVINQGCSNRRPQVRSGPR